MNEEDELEKTSPEELGASIRALVLASRQSRKYRKTSVRPGDLRALCSWEREITENYGVVRKKKR